MQGYPIFRAFFLGFFFSSINFPPPCVLCILLKSNVPVDPIGVEKGVCGVVWEWCGDIPDCSFIAHFFRGRSDAQKHEHDRICVGKGGGGERNLLVKDLLLGWHLFFVPAQHKPATMNEKERWRTGVCTPRFIYILLCFVFHFFFGLFFCCVFCLFLKNCFDVIFLRLQWWPGIWWQSGNFSGRRREGADG